VLYLEAYGAPDYLPGYLSLQKHLHFTSKSGFEEFLNGINVSNKDEIRLVTEAALMASLFNKSIPKNLGVNSDDAKQFKLFCH
jgi:hypothetical protein